MYKFLLRFRVDELIKIIAIIKLILNKISVNANIKEQKNEENQSEYRKKREKIKENKEIKSKKDREKETNN